MDLGGLTQGGELHEEEDGHVDNDIELQAEQHQRGLEPVTAPTHTRSNGETPIAAAIVENPTEAAVLSKTDVEELVKPGLRRRLYIALCAAICVIIAIIVGVTVSVTTRNDELTTFSPTSSPTTSPTLTFESRVEYLKRTIIENTAPKGNSSAFIPNTPQYAAFDWLSKEEPMLQDEIRILQRYVLALFYFATKGAEWHRENIFLDPGHECNWMETGITCQENGFITELDLCECTTVLLSVR